MEYLLVHHKRLWKEIKEVIEQADAASCKTKVSKEKTMMGKLLYSPVDMNKAFCSLLHAKNWQESRVSYWVTKDEKLIRETLSKSAEGTKS